VTSRFLFNASRLLSFVHFDEYPCIDLRVRQLGYGARSIRIRSPCRSKTLITTVCSWVKIWAARKAAILTQGQNYFGGESQFYFGGDS
jgi:hypothetical protein